MILTICLISFVSCGGDEDDISASSAAGKTCQSNSDCQIGLHCDAEKKICTNGSESSESEEGNTNENDSQNGENGGGNSDENGDNPGGQDGDSDPITGKCEPGKKQTCGYQGPSGTENVGPCRASVRECKPDGTWTPCDGEVLPVYEAGDLCSDGIDNDCNGTVDDGSDADGDGVKACEDCCETTEQCPDPAAAWDAGNPEHFCAYEKITYECDEGIPENSTDPVDYAKTIGLCKIKDPNDPNDWGLISATITDPTGGSAVHAGSNGLLSAFGNVIKPKDGKLMLALTSSKLGNPITNPDYSGGTTSGAPSDWLDEQNPKGKFPAAKSCTSGSGTSGLVNDAVMLTLEIKTPKTAKSFSFNIYFITKEYPNFICSSYNDFFIALLDSGYTSDDPNLKNPKDKNLAMDENGNPVGINLAPDGLFTQCSPTNSYPKTKESCKGTAELKGTGFDSNGGTGWLTTRGNINGGETIKLRLAIWDLKDWIYDSIVLIDNFRWDATEQKPGTGL